MTLHSPHLGRCVLAPKQQQSNRGGRVGALEVDVKLNTMPVPMEGRDGV